MPVEDVIGRPLRDLRVSVTDRCNFRCTYCMPKEVFGKDFRFLPRDELLSFEEIARLARIFTGLGAEKIRLTGGEPLLRRGLEKLIGMLSTLPVDLTLTTNGSLLAQQARTLREAGLRRLAVSLDSLDDETFRLMNDMDFPVARVLEGIDAAIAAGFSPLKINMVVRRGINERDVPAMARRFSGSDFILRFIEYMDVGNTNGWRMEDVVPASELIGMLSSQMPLEAVAPNYPGEVARRFLRRDTGGEIGVIASVTQPFCRGCTRARLSSDGKLYTCLFASQGHDLRTPLREGASDAEIAARIGTIWGARDDRYSEIRAFHTRHESKVEMSHIGG